MGGSVGAVQTDGNTPYTGIHNLAGHLLCYQGAIGGQRHTHAQACGVAGNIEDVVPEKRFATAQN
jgi:hypothetical protein